jgi:hypothetical protein
MSQTPAEKVASVLRVELELWQVRVLNAVLRLPSWPELGEHGTERGRVETVLSPEQRARADWASWSGHRASVRDES